MTLIFLASSVSDVPPLPGDVSDKTMHFWVYAVLGALILRALARGTLSGCTLPRAVTAVLCSVLYGMSDELHQYFVPGRSPSVADVVADTVGAAAGVACIVAVAKITNRPGRGSGGFTN
jgi:VanZ family protein